MSLLKSISYGFIQCLRPGYLRQDQSILPIIRVIIPICYFVHYPSTSSSRVTIFATYTIYY